jgi:hypothetical protein
MLVKLNEINKAVDIHRSLSELPSVYKRGEFSFHDTTKQDAWKVIYKADSLLGKPLVPGLEEKLDAVISGGFKIGAYLITREGAIAAWGCYLRRENVMSVMSCIVRYRTEDPRWRETLLSIPGIAFEYLSASGVSVITSWCPRREFELFAKLAPDMGFALYEDQNDSQVGRILPKAEGMAFMVCELAKLRGSTWYAENVGTGRGLVGPLGSVP